jgi:hypothetical protein
MKRKRRRRTRHDGGDGDAAAALTEAPATQRATMPRTASWRR